MMAFLWHSLFRAYGWRFLWHVALPHPFRTLRALRAAGRLNASGDCVEVPGSADADSSSAGAHALVGAGFCLKPLACPSGRFNHGCATFEAGRPVADCCGECEIRRLGVRALEAGKAFYIMTSARDILFDVYLPALQERRFTSGQFYLCRYSFRPFAAGLLASGIRSRLIAFGSGDCRDYVTWLKADVGVKAEQTVISEPGRQRPLARGDEVKGRSLPDAVINKRNGVFYPAPSENVCRFIPTRL